LKISLVNAGGAAQRLSRAGTTGNFLSRAVAILAPGISLSIGPGANLVVGAGHKELNVFVWPDKDSMTRLDQYRVAGIR
jgi:hypothetical protein